MNKPDGAVLATVECEIRRLYARCVDAVWRKDYAAFSDCFTTDGEWKIVGFHFRGREQIGSGLEQLSRDNARVLLIPGIPVLNVNKDSVSGRTMLTELVKRKDGRGAATIGTYYEGFEQQDNRWLFRWRHFEMHYFGAADLSDAFFPSRDYGPPPGMPAADDSTLMPDLSGGSP